MNQSTAASSRFKPAANRRIIPDKRRPLLLQNYIFNERTTQLKTESVFQTQVKMICDESLQKDISGTLTKDLALSTWISTDWPNSTRSHEEEHLKRMTTRNINDFPKNSKKFQKQHSSGLMQTPGHE